MASETREPQTRKANFAMPLQLTEYWTAPLKPHEGRSMKEASSHITVRIRNLKKSRQLIDESMALPVKEGATNKQKGHQTYLIKNKQRYTQLGARSLTCQPARRRREQ